VIFMGGLQSARRLPAAFQRAGIRVLLAYAVVEGITGVIALVFHGAFDGITQFSLHTSFRNAFGDGGPVYKWGRGRS